MAGHKRIDAYSRFFPIDLERCPILGTLIQASKFMMAIPLLSSRRVGSTRSWPQVDCPTACWTVPAFGHASA